MISSSSGSASAEGQARGQKDSHRLGNEPWAGIELQDALPAGGAVSGFFNQFALGGFQFLFARINAAGRQFPQIIPRSMAILPFQKNPRRGAGIVYGQHHDGARMVDQVSPCFHPAGFLHVVGADPKYGTAIDDAGRDESSFGLFAAPRFGEEEDLAMQTI